MKAYPFTPITALVDEAKMLTIPFRNWFRDLSDFWNKTNTNTSNNVVTSLIGPICFIEYVGKSGIEITLPYKPLHNSILRYKQFDDDGFNHGTMEIIKDVTTITLPDFLENIYLKDWYFVS